MELQNRNVVVLSDACDVADNGQLTNLLDSLRKMRMPQIRGVIQGAMILRVST